MFLKNAWHQAGWSHEFQEGELFSRRLLDEPLVLFRDLAGAAHAVADVPAQVRTAFERPTGRRPPRVWLSR